MHLNPSSLELINKSSADPEECLSSVLADFLKKNYDLTSHGVPSWRLIVAAVGYKAGGNNKGLALQIADNHPDKRGLN